MVRIVIDTEGDNVATTVPQGETAAQTAPEPPPPAEVLAAAAAVGARDAGPAPTFAPPTAGAPSLPQATPQAGVQATGSQDQSAGSAPGTKSEPEPTVVTEDGE
jgi:hypothetical protein